MKVENSWACDCCLYLSAMESAISVFFFKKYLHTSKRTPAVRERERNQNRDEVHGRRANCTSQCLINKIQNCLLWCRWYSRLVLITLQNFIINRALFFPLSLLLPLSRYSFIISFGWSLLGSIETKFSCWPPETVVYAVFHCFNSWMQFDGVCLNKPNWFD